MIFNYNYIKEEMAKRKLDTLVGGARLNTLWSCAILQGNRADMAEIGVYRGGSAFVISEALIKAKIYNNFYIIDTFTGIPFISEEDEGFHTVGEFRDTNYGNVKTELEKLRDNNKVFRGLLKPDFINYAPQDSTYSFVHIDVDVYQSVIDCLEYFWPKLIIGGMIILDDPHMSSCPGALKALNDFVPSIEDKSISYKLPTRQAYIMKIGE